MHCIRCQSETRYNRAVVTLDDETVRGGFCAECERTVFGRALIERPFAHLDGCIECPNAGVAAIPEHELEISIETDNEYVTEGYVVDEETPVFCREHLPAQFARLTTGDGRTTVVVDRV